MNIEELTALKTENDIKGAEVQHNLKKSTAKERVAALLDQGTFIEVGALINSNGGGAITGYGTINGKLVYIYSNDYTVDGGVIHKVNSKKISDIMDMAAKMGAPLIQIFDSVGGSIAEGLNIITSYASLIKKSAKLSGVIPVFSIIAGPCTGSAAICASMSDFTIIVNEAGELYINSPEDVTKSNGEFISAEHYGRNEALKKSGTVQLVAKDEDEANELLRKLFAFIPSNNLELPQVKIIDDLNKYEEAFNEISEAENYDIYQVINLLSDNNSLIEIGKGYGDEIVTALASLNGMPIGIIANNKSVDNALIGKAACEKTAGFVRLCDSFNISILSLVDTKGFTRNIKEEQEGLTKYAGRLAYALAESSVPKVSLLIGEAYGSAYIVLGSKDSCFDFSYAWPSAKLSIGEPDALVSMMYRNDILSSDRPKEREMELLKLHRDELTSVRKAAEEGLIDDIIIPAETKTRLFAVLDMLQSKREIGYAKKHGSVLI